MRHQNILVIGGAGFIGGHLVARLAADGRRVTVPSRRRETGKRLILLPTVDVVDADVNDAATLAKLVEGQDAVINLVGILHGDAGRPYGKAFAAAHVALPERIVAACRAAGVQRLVHMSALGADAQGASMYLRSKADGEKALAASTLATTIFRPSVVFGRDDRFTNLFATLQRVLPIVPLARAKARFQPVFVEDVAAAFVVALDDSATFGGTYELAGPRIYPLAELVRMAGAWRAGGNGRARPILPLPDFLGRLQASVLEFAPGPTLMSRDNFDSMQGDNIATGRYPGLSDLGIEAVPLEQEAPIYLGRKSRRSHLDHLRNHAHR